MELYIERGPSEDGMHVQNGLSSSLVLICYDALLYVLVVSSDLWGTQFYTMEMVIIVEYGCRATGKP